MTIPTFEKGNRNNSNYSGVISLLMAISNVYKNNYSKICKIAECLLMKEHTRFRKGNSCINNTFAIQNNGKS